MNTASHSKGSASRVSGEAFSTSNQGELFQRLLEPSRLEREQAGEMDVRHELLGAIHVALKYARTLGYGRERIAERMNQALHDKTRPVTLRQLNAWTAVSKEFHELPARYLAAFCWACRCDEPLRVIAGALGLYLADSRDLAAKRLGEIRIQSAGLTREARSLQRTLGE